MATTTRRSRREPTVPQPTAPKEADPAQAEREAQEAAWQALVERATSGDTAPARQVKRALALEAERAALMKRIADNREYMRLMDRNEELDDDQAEFLDTFYPEKERGQLRSKEDIEATRKAREAARKTNTD